MSTYWKSISLTIVLAAVSGLGTVVMPDGLAYAADLYEHHSGTTGMAYPSGGEWYAQTFTAQSSHQVTSVKLYLSRYGTPGSITVSIRATDGSGRPTGSDLTSGATDGNTLPVYGTGKEWREVTFSSALSLTQGAMYAIVVRAINGNASNTIAWNASYGGGGDLYVGGALYKSLSSGSSWTEEYQWDGSFEVWGPWTPPPNQPPALSNGYVSPSSGGISTDFYYYVDYYDVDGDSPSTKNVSIDHVPYAMTLFSGSASNGTYRYGPVNLDCSAGFTYHRYAFSFDDGQGHTTCLPSSCGAFTLGPDAPITMGEAVDNMELSWSSGGDATWFGVCDQYHWDHDAAQSGYITHNQVTWLQTTIKGPGALSFYWKTYSEPVFDNLVFYMDDIYQDSISGSTDWQNRSFSVPSGTHTLKWQYEKDGSVNSGWDCAFVDRIEFVRPPVAPMLFLLLD